MAEEVVALKSSSWGRWVVVTLLVSRLRGAGYLLEKYASISEDFTEQAANRAAGIGDEQGRLPSRVKKEEVMAKCTVCSAEIRMTARNIEAKAHFESKHPTSTFASCFPGQFDPTVAPTAEAKGTDSDTTPRAVAAPAAAAAPKKKKEDLSFLDAALIPSSGKKK